MTVVLIGYMASGKSTLGNILAKELKYDFIDLDEYIENQEGMDVKTIFKSKGELYFRKVETLHLHTLLTHKKDMVLSLGGGTPCYGNNMEMILKAECCKSFYLKASLSYLVERLKFKKSKRPLIAHLETDEELQEFIAKHLFERAPFYEMANVKITIDDKSEKAIVDEVMSFLV